MTSPLATEFRNSYLLGRSYRLQEPPVFPHTFDLVFTASSWDRRCTMLLNVSDLTARNTLCYFPEAKDTIGLRETHDKAIAAFWTAKADQFIPITGPSASVEQILERLQQQLATLISSRSSKLKVLIDISACPRYLSLSVMGLLLHGGFCSSIHLFYGEGRYSSSEPLEVAFTAGQWRVIAVPPFYGKYDGTLPKSYVISTGFEGGKTARAVSQAEPDKVSLLLPEPGFIKEYEDRSQSQARRLVEEFSIPASRILKAPAGDSIAAWKALTSANIYDKDEENLFCLCAGTKAHAFALALHCLSVRTAALLYVVPDEHKVLDIKPSNIQWVFEITDLTAFE